MIIGVPKEIKNNENRVALTPAGTQELVKRGHAVFVQTTAGVGSGFTDEEYVKAGAKMIPDAAEVFHVAEMIMKVKEPVDAEYKLIKKDQLVFTYFHFASYEPLTKAELFASLMKPWKELMAAYHYLFQCRKLREEWLYRRVRNIWRNH